MYVKENYSWQMKMIREKIHRDMVEIKKSLKFYKDLYKEGSCGGYISREVFAKHIEELQNTYDKYVAAYNAMK